MEVFEGFFHAGVVRVENGFLNHVIAVGPQQTQTFRRAESRVNAVVVVRPEPPPARPVGGDSLIKPAGDGVQLSQPTGPLLIGQTHQLARGVGVPDDRPHRGAGVVFGVVLTESAIGGRGVLGRLSGLACGAVVVVDRPQLQRRTRQHRPPPKIAGPDPSRGHGSAHLRCAEPMLAQNVQMCHTFWKVIG